MRIQMLDALTNEDTTLIMVEFSTPFGNSLGEWRDVVPERYSYHHVEIETAHSLTWGQDIEPAAEESFLIDYDMDNLVTLQGKLENFEDDGTAYLRLGSGLVTLETEGPFTPPLDTFIRVHAKKIVLFPYEA